MRTAQFPSKKWTELTWSELTWLKMSSLGSKSELIWKNWAYLGRFWAYLVKTEHQTNSEHQKRTYQISSELIWKMIKNWAYLVKNWAYLEDPCVFLFWQRQGQHYLRAPLSLVRKKMSSNRIDSHLTTNRTQIGGPGLPGPLPRDFPVFRSSGLSPGLPRPSDLSPVSC